MSAAERRLTKQVHACSFLLAQAQIELRLDTLAQGSESKRENKTMFVRYKSFDRAMTGKLCMFFRA